MALDLQEQEQVEALKAWWKTHGNKVIAGVVLFVLAVAGHRAWTAYQQRELAKAAQLSQVLAEALSAGDAKKVRTVAGEIMDKHPRTPYAVDAALLAAKTNAEAGDFKSAKNQLEWVIRHARDAESRDLARLNLAGVLLDEKQYDAALAQLDQAHGAAFEALFSERRGDVLAAQGKIDAARAAYRAALDRLPGDAPARGVLEIKLDALGNGG